MKSVHAYDLTTGLLDGRSMTSSDPEHYFTAPAGCGFVEGVTDWRAQKVDLASGLLVDYTQPSPSLEEQKASASREIAVRIAGVESQQLRALREVVLGQAVGGRPQAIAALANLRAIDDAISKQRDELDAIAAATSFDDLVAALERSRRKQAPAP